MNLNIDRTLIMELLPHMATWVTVLLVWCTLREMTRQRRASYRPDLVLCHADIYAYVGENGIPNYWFEQDQGEDGIDLSSIIPTGFGIPIKNIGLGAAREIQASWKYDRNKLLESVGELISRFPGRLTVEQTKQDFLVVKPHGHDPIGVSIRSELIRYLEFVLPSTLDNQGDIIRLPSSYILLCSIGYYLDNFEEKVPVRSSDVFKFPSLDLKIRYKDIGGSTHKKTYAVNFSNFSGFFGTMHSGEEMFSARFVTEQN